MITDIINGDVDEGPRQLLLASRLIGIYKANRRDICPVAVGDAFYRTAAITALDLVPVHSLFAGTAQFGVGRSGGSERALSAICAAIDLNGPNTALITLD